MQAKGNLCDSINAADLYSPTAFDVVLDLFERPNKDVQWLTGRAVIYNEKKQLVYIRLPYKYRANLIQCGLYGEVFPHIQQESTFWSAELNSKLDLEELRTFKLAGDMYLWHTLSHHAQLYIVAAWLGGYRHHEGNLSADMEAYNSEARRFLRKPTPEDYEQAEIDKPFWDSSDEIKARNNSEGIFHYNTKRKSYY